MHLKIKEPCQIRHTALRLPVLPSTDLDQGSQPYLFHVKIRPYPHNVLREHKMATGAGADRVSGGMRAAFGKAAGTAARVQADDIIMTLRVTPQAFPTGKEALWMASMKLPSPCYMEIVKGAELVA